MRGVVRHLHDVYLVHSLKYLIQETQISFLHPHAFPLCNVYNFGPFPYVIRQKSVHGRLKLLVV